MKAEIEERRWNLAWALPASLILHALIAAFLVYSLPRPAQQLDQEQPVNVALVPPPEQPKPKPPTTQPKEPKAERPPEPKTEKPPEQKVEKPPLPEKQAAQDTDQQQADKQEAGAQTAEKQTTVAPTPSGAESDGKVELPAAVEKPKPKPVNTLKFRPAKGSKSRSRSAGTPGSTNAAVAGSPIYSGLPGVRKLYSQGATGDALATSSMSGVPRDQRVANLCGSVLNQELQDASYSPKWLPSIPLKVGNVLSPPEAAFSTTTTWYRLGFRCEVDADATRVLSFSFRVGAEIPPGEWARLRLPSLH
ncbi:MAG: DUF930 domain-containing protein [Mesorhizobium sp.]|nr:MAG: DUF930 domain-containing protein [Mesorhizobium sp.]